MRFFLSNLAEKSLVRDLSQIADGGTIDSVDNVLLTQTVDDICVVIPYFENIVLETRVLETVDNVTENR